jgi:ankyrin repeat protein
VLAELKGSLPNDNTVIALFMPDMPTQTDPAHAFLASLLGQLLTRVPTADIPQVILDGLNATNPPLPSVNVIKEALGQLLRSFKRVYLILDNLGDYWDQGALPLWTVIMGPRFANLRLLLTMQTFQNPSMTTSCTVCGKEELLVYWHCTTCKGGNFDACSTCHERRLSCQNPSHRCVLTDVQKEKAVVDVDSFYPHAIPDIDFARRIDLKLLTINQRNQSRAEAGGLLMTQYDSIFDDISSNPHERLIIKALDIVYHALRTLTVDEFLAAISLSQDLSVSDISQIITWTGGLMKVSMDAGGVFCVQLFDISLTEHLQRKKDKLFALGHTTLAKACLQVLSTQASPTELIPTGKTKPLGSSLYDYAVCTWGSHLRACPPSPILEDMALRYLRDDEKLNLGTLTAYTVQPEAMAYGFDTGDGLAAVHVCSLFGLTSLLQRLPTTELDRPARGTGRTPLAYACRMGHVDTVMFLLESGANLGSRSADGLIVNAGSGSALGRASTHGHVKIVQLLLDAGADVNSQDSAAENSGETPLMSASEMGHTDIAKSLVEHGADLNAQDCVARSFGETPLISASRMGHASIVKLLLESGADPNLKTAVGSTALHEAIKSGVVPVVEVLLRWPDVKLTSITSREGEIVSLLTSLFQLRSLDILKLALTRDDLDINEKDQNGRTTLWWLLSASHDEYDSDFQLGAAKLIIQHPRCDANVVDLAGRTYVMRFLNARILNAELLGLLLEHSVDIDREDEDGETAIFHAVTLRYSMQMTSVLIDHGADLTVKDSRGQGLLHRLVTDLDGVQDLQHLDLLLERNPALKDSRDEDGRTALHLALILDKLDLAKELLARGTIVDLRDRSGKTPLDVACQLGHTSVVAELTENVIHRSILGTPFEDSGMAALEIVSFAHKSLRMNEFEHALIYLIEGRSLRSARHPKLIGLVEYTRSLLNLQQNRVLFAQEQVSAYFEQTRDRWFPSGQANMAFACLRVLTSEKLPTESAVDWVFSPLYRYAACEWAKHVYAYSPKLALVDDLAVRYLKDTRRLDMGNKVAFGSVGQSGLDALHICSMFGLTSTILRLWAHPHGSELNINSQTNDHKRTPLVYAASMGHLDTLKLLLELGADPYLTTTEGCTALCEALKQDRRLIVAHFLDSPTLRLDTMITGNIRATALMQIQDFTSVELVRALLKRPDIDVNESDGRGFTVLSHLLMNSSKHEPAFRAEVAQLIVEAPGFDMSAVDAQGKGYAQQLLDGPDFHEELLLVLLEHGIDLGHRDHEGKNAMSYAIARHSTTSAIRLLLDHGAGTNEEGSTLRELMQLIPSYRNHGIHGVQSASHSYWT